MPVARALIAPEVGGPEVLTLGTLEVRDPGPEELLVEVAAAGVNRADLLQRRGLYPAPPGFPKDVLGLEYAGRVAAVGSGVRRLKVGDPVMSITGGGAMATHLIAHEREVMRVPEGIDLQVAAAIPEVFLTAYDALFLQGMLMMGERLLIHAVCSGVGTAALQLAKLVHAEVAGTSRSAEKLESCRGLCLDHALHVTDGSFAASIESFFPEGANLILDTVGGAYLEENLQVVAKQGRVVIVGLLGGARGTLNLGALLSKRVMLRGTVLRSRPLEEKIALIQSFAAQMLPFFEDGRLAPVIDSVLPMSEAAEAHRRLEKNENVGKVVLCW